MRLGTGNNERKPRRECSKPMVEKVGGKYYFVGGPDQVHLLNHEQKDDEEYSRRLSEAELSELPVEIVWTGNETKDFSNQEEEAFSLLVSIIRNMNLMQDTSFHSFPLGDYIDQLSIQLNSTK